MKQPTLLTLFAGGGLVDEGLKGLVLPVGAVEVVPEIAAHYKLAHGVDPTVQDVGTVDFSQWAGVDYVHASPVCKRFSAAKSGVVGGDDEGEPIDIHTAKGVVRAIEQVQPKIFSLENVPRYIDSQAMKLIRDALDANGYDGDEAVYEASDFGTPSKRKRLLLRAWEKGLKKPAKPRATKRVGWYEALADLVPMFQPSKLAPWQVTRLPDLDTLPVIIAGGSAFKGQIPFAYADQPAPTIKATPGEPLRLMLDDGRIVSVSTRGVARLQGLPDSYPLPEQRALALTIIGNGVPPPLARAVLAPLVAIVEGR